LLERARRGRYQEGTLRELAGAQREAAFERDGDDFVITARHRDRVRWVEQDLRRERPPGRFDMVLCRNLAFTYFDDALQLTVAARIADALIPGGALVVGAHEAPPRSVGLLPWPGVDHVYQRR
jgi:chemotaxis protein methyltransferase CheR